MRLWFDQIDPPAGRLLRVSPDTPRAGDAEPIEFCGWLGLLRVLSEVLGGSDDALRKP
jgi:hypothetical protein